MMSTSFLPMELDLACNQVFDFSDSDFIALIKGPFLDSFTTHQARMRKDSKMFARRGLTYSQLSGDEDGAHAVLGQVAVDLRRGKFRRGVLSGEATA